MVDLDEVALKAAADRLAGEGADVRAVVADVAEPGRVGAPVEAGSRGPRSARSVALQRFRDQRWRRSTRWSPDQWDRQIAVNLHVRVPRDAGLPAAAPELPRIGRPHVIGARRCEAWPATRLRRDQGRVAVAGPATRRGATAPDIRVNAVVPGPIFTAAWDRVGEQDRARSVAADSTQTVRPSGGGRLGCRVPRLGRRVLHHGHEHHGRRRMERRGGLGMTERRGARDHGRADRR